MLAIALISMAVLGYQILLMRLFSIIQWHHFAYMMISLALLGYGVSATFITLFRARLARHYAATLVTSAALFGLTAIAAFLLAQQVPFNALEIFWDWRQPLWLLSMYLLLLVPFFLAGTCICLTFVCYGEHTHRIYGFDLLGAASGCLLIIALLFTFSPMRALQICGAIPFAAAALAALHMRFRSRVSVPLLLGGALLVLLAPQSSLPELRLSEYKSLSQALHVSGARAIAQRSGPLGLLTVVESPRVPFRHAPGLSLNAVQEPPAQLGIFTDGEGPAALTQFDGDLHALDYLAQMTSALPYHLLHNPHVLVLGASAGADVLQAVQHRARRIDAVELNAQMIDLVRNRYAAFAGHLYERSEVRLHNAEARGFVAASDARYDLIQLALLDAFGTASAGLYGSSENYLYTVEALSSYLAHLHPGGLLAITRWATLPPRDTLKLFGTAVTALERNGVTMPGRRLVMVRGLQTVTLLVRNGEFSTADIALMRAFSEQRSFDTAWYPGIRAEETNRFNRLDVPWFHQGAVALLGPDRERFIERYKFNITPATDDRPYFFNFFRWRTLPEILALKARGGLPLLELGYPVLVATLIQATAASALLILLPLWLGKTGRATVPAVRVFVYFAALGLAFMFVEIAFIQKFTLLLAHPLYAVAVVLCGFLLFAGLGSRYSRRAGTETVWKPVLAIILWSMVCLSVFPVLFDLAAGLADALKMLMSLALIAPLAFSMGMPFPRAMATLAAHSPASVPWAFGINACASVVGATFAALLAIHFGFTVVVGSALALYGLAALLVPRAPASP